MALRTADAEHLSSENDGVTPKSGDPLSSADSSQNSHPSSLATLEEASNLSERDLLSMKSDILPAVDRPPNRIFSTGGFDLLCSYNWTHGPSPKLIIPGGPPLWHDVPVPLQLKKETGSCVIDANDAYSPDATFEPLFRALSVCRPDYKFADVDLLVNRNSLRKLFDLCRGKSTQAFRLRLHLIGTTIVIERCEDSAFADDPDTRGFGHAFEETFTKQDDGLESSACHHRVIRYKIGDLNCVVRFEVDGCYQPEPSETREEAPLPSMPAAHQNLSKIEVILKEGYPASLPIVELKTATRKSKRSTGLYLPQLWFGRVHYLKQGRHSDGFLERVTSIRASELFEEWETRYQDDLCRMERTIRDLIHPLQRNPRGLIAVWKGGSPGDEGGLTLSEPDEPKKQPLPAEIVRQFWGEKLPEFQGKDRCSDEPSESGWYS